MNLLKYYHSLLHVECEIKKLDKYSHDDIFEDLLDNIAGAIGNAKASVIRDEAKKYRKLKGIHLKD